MRGAGCVMCLWLDDFQHDEKLQMKRCRLFYSTVVDFVVVSRSKDFNANSNSAVDVRGEGRGGGAPIL